MTPEEHARQAAAQAAHTDARIVIRVAGGLQFGTTQAAWLSRYCAELRKNKIHFYIDFGDSDDHQAD